MVKSKSCRDCGGDRPVSCVRCRDCAKKQSQLKRREYRRTNGTKFRAREAKWRDKNRERLRIYNRDYKRKQRFKNRLRDFISEKVVEEVKDD